MIKLPKRDSQNRKLGKGVRATYRQVGPTCPNECEHLKTKACYALYGFVNIHSNKSQYHETDAERLENYLLNLPEGQKVRHHVSGDFMKPGNEVDEEYVNAMVRAHHERPDLKGWGYTHAWQQLDSKKLNSAESLAVNASCDSTEEITEAIEQGWPATTVVSEDCEGDLIDGQRVVVCPQQTHDIPCSECMLCFRKKRQCVVGFRVHGTGKTKFTG